MTRLKSTLLLVLLFRSVLFAEDLFAEDTRQFQIRGTVAGLIKEGEAVLSTSAEILGEKIEVARVKIRDGAFSLVGEFEEIQRANVAMVSAEGRGQGSVDIVLEAAPIRISYGGKYAGFQADGDGKYTKVLIAPWQQSKEYRKALDEFEMTANQRDTLKDGPQKEALTKKYWELYYVMPKIRSNHLDNIANSNEDPLASSLAIQFGGLRTSEDAVARLNELEATLGPQAGLVNRRKAIEGAIVRRLNAQLMKKNAQGITVSAKNIEGKAFELSAVLKEHKYVLLEFWASWCGPCLKEVPHLKSAYQEFNEKGFEIFSVSLDEDRQRWVDASEGIAAPWINVCDLKAYDSPAAMKFGVQIVPRNFLLDKNGKVIASDLRGEALSAKLQELLGG